MVPNNMGANIRVYLVCLLANAAGNMCTDIFHQTEYSERKESLITFKISCHEWAVLLNSSRSVIRGNFYLRQGRDIRNFYHFHRIPDSSHLPRSFLQSHHKVNISGVGGWRQKSSIHLEEENQSWDRRRPKSMLW